MIRSSTGVRCGVVHRVSIENCDVRATSKTAAIQLSTNIGKALLPEDLHDDFTVNYTNVA